MKNKLVRKIFRNSFYFILFLFMPIAIIIEWFFNSFSFKETWKEYYTFLKSEWGGK